MAKVYHMVGGKQEKEEEEFITIIHRMRPTILMGRVNCNVLGRL